MVAVYIAIFIIFLLVIILFLPAKFNIKIEEEDVSIKLIFLNVIKIRIKEKTKDEKNKKNKVNFKELSFWEKKQFIKLIFPSIEYLVAKSKLKVTLYGTVGLSSADKTAITVGLVNMVLYQVEAIFSKMFNRYQGKYNISPNFTREIIKYNLSIGLSAKSFYVLAFLLKFTKALKKYKNKYAKDGVQNARASNRRTNENYNGQPQGNGRC